ncbi:MAG: radical SAM protein [Chloroflexota bacterium]
MIKEIETKGILNHVKQPDDWFGLKYNMNLYRGCQHRCIYCDSRSECYQIEDFDGEVLVKTNAVELLADALPRKRIKGTIGTGSMNDPYMPVEKKFNLTGRAMEVIAENCFPVHILTKSDLVLKDLETIRQINKAFAAVSFTITTADDKLGKQVEPGAPRVSRRFAAMKILADAGVHTGLLLMPVLPFIEDNAENLTAIFEKAADHGASYLVPSLGMSLRDRQREYYYDQLDQLFPGIREKYVQQFGSRYFAPANSYQQLNLHLEQLSEKFDLPLKMPMYTPVKNSKQIPMFS